MHLNPETISIIASEIYVTEKCPTCGKEIEIGSEYFNIDDDFYFEYTCSCNHEGTIIRTLKGISSSISLTSGVQVVAILAMLLATIL